MPTGARSWTTPRTGLVRVVQIAVLVAAVGGTLAFVGLDKTVTLSVDGHRRTVHTLGRSVASVLARAGIGVGAHDSVVPVPGASVPDDGTIVVRRGRRLTLSVDGQPRTAWVTARWVGEALDQLGLPDRGLFTSVARNRAIPLTGLALAVRLPHQVGVWVDGQRRNVVTTAPTVAQLLADNGITLGPLDVASAPLTARPADGLVLTVSRVRDARRVETVPVPFDVHQRPDPSLPVGTTRVATPGAAGALKRVYAVRQVDGRVVSQQLVESTVAAPRQDKIVLVGTKPSPAPLPSPPSPAHPRPAPAAAAVHPAAVPGAAAGRVDELNWSALAACESGGDPRAVSADGQYHGLYQFRPDTWASVGGQGDPAAAPASEQTARAKLLYSREGTDPWPVCGGHLYD